MKPRLAICIPAHNETKLLPKLMAAIGAQTVPFDEVWLYDDCSTDGTAELAESHGARVVRGTHNVGCSAGKNALAERTTCEWVHFLDADDIPLPHFVERAHQWMNKPDAPDVVLFHYEYRDLHARTRSSTRFASRSTMSAFIAGRDSWRPAGSIWTRRCATTKTWRCTPAWPSPA